MHRDQHRKGTPVPYIAHVVAVAAVTLQVRRDEEQAIGALLHDTLEDTTVIRPPRCAPSRVDFGDAVLRHRRGLHGFRRSAEAAVAGAEGAVFAHVREKAHPDSLLVSAADKLHNLHALPRDYRHEGDTLWERFNKDAGRAGILWYHRALAEVFRDRLGGRLAADSDLAVTALERVVPIT